MKDIRSLSDEHIVGAAVKLVNLHKSGELDLKGNYSICKGIVRYYFEHYHLSQKQLFALQGIVRRYYDKLRKYGKIRPLKLYPSDRVIRYVDEHILAIHFRYSEDLVRYVKYNIEDSRWDEVNKRWTAKLSIRNLELLQLKQFLLDDKIAQWYRENKNQFRLDKDFSVPGLQGTLLPFQIEGVQFIEEKHGRALIADEMGLGKTVQALAWLQLHSEKSPVVIICPSSVKYNWAVEADKWLENPTIYVLSGLPTKPVDFQQYLYSRGNSPEIYICNYDILANRMEKFEDPLTGQMRSRQKPGTGWRDHLRKLNPEVLILDEVHYMKNPKAGRSKAILSLGRRIPHIIALSGTPIKNRPMEFYPIINLLQPELFPNAKSFGIKYCDGHHNGFGWDFTGSSNTEELHEILSKHLMIRRKKSEVYKQLPPKIRSVIPIEIDNRKEYQKAERSFLSWLESVDPSAVVRAQRSEALVKVEKLRKLAVDGKLKQCIEWIDNFLESGLKLVLFCYHRDVAERLLEKYTHYDSGGCAVLVYGGTKDKERQRAKEIFQTDDRCKIFIGTLKAASEGITLTAASDVAFIELGWTPGDMDQAEDRVHRIGQKSQNINAWYLLAKDTIEERFAEILDEKRETIDAIVDGHTSSRDELLIELLNDMKNGI